MKYRNVRQNARPFSGSFCRALFRRLRRGPAETAVATTTAPSILDQAPQFNATIEKVAPIPVPTEQASSQGNQKYHDIIVRPPEKELSSEAKGYPGHTALYSGNPRRGRSRQLLEAAGLLQQVKAPANVWMDGGVWLMKPQNLKCRAFP